MSFGYANIVWSTNAEEVASQVDRLNSSVKAVGESSAGAAATSDVNWGRFGSTLGRVGVMGVIAMDRLQISQIAVENAQERAISAQDRYTDAVEKFGPASDQARRAHRELEISMRGVEIAQQREQVRMLVMAGVVVPQMVAGVYRLIQMMGTWDKTNQIVTLSTIALTNAQRALLAASIVGIPLLIAGLAFSAGAFSEPASNVNVYGDVNMRGAMTPAAFGTATQTWSQTGRPG